jgi:hypothetical protein
MPIRQRILVGLCAGAIVANIAACGPPAPPPTVITGVSSEVNEFVLTATVHDASGVIAYHCFADVPYTVALTDANGVEYQAVTQAIATSHVVLSGANCNPYFWTIRLWMDCVPDCGGPQGLWTGAEPRRVTMPFKREPGLATVRVHIEATYGGVPAEGQRVAELPTILCGITPTSGVRTCLFPI